MKWWGTHRPDVGGPERTRHVFPSCHRRAERCSCADALQSKAVGPLERDFATPGPGCPSPPPSIRLEDLHRAEDRIAPTSRQWGSDCLGCIEPSARRSPRPRARNGSWLLLSSAHILMHDPPLDQPRVWLLAGTGDGPRLTSALLQRNWRVRVSVVSPAAAEAYRGLAVESMAFGALGGVRGIAEELKRQATLHWVV